MSVSLASSLHALEGHSRALLKFKELQEVLKRKIRINCGLVGQSRREPPPSENFELFKTASG